MAEAASAPTIRLRGVRHNNLKNFDLDLPIHRLLVVTGRSGSGKSSLAFDTLYAEGQRRYIETFSPYARQFFDRMDKPRVDSIEGIPPAIAIEQRNAVRTTRSTVGTMTEICDYLKLLWPQLAQLHCRGCGRPVRQDPPQQIWRALAADRAGRATEVLVTFDLPFAEKLSLAESLALIARQGYQRLLVQGEVVRLDEAEARITGHTARIPSLTVVQDRLRLSDSHRARFVEACEQAYHFGKGKLAIHRLGSPPAAPAADPSVPAAALRSGDGDSQVRRFSSRRHCADCDLEYRDPTPALFSFNHPLGACPACKGFGRIIGIDYRRALPDPTKTLGAGAIRPWQSGVSAECQEDLLKFCRLRGVPMDVPFEQLSAEHQRWVMDGDVDYGKDAAHEWPRAWYGVKGYFRWLESKAYKMHVRVLLSRYRSYTPCPACGGKRLQPEALLYRLSRADGEAPLGVPAGDFQSSAVAPSAASLTLADFYALPIRDACALVDRLAARHGLKPADPLGVPLEEVRARLGYLVEVGLGYLTLDRPTRTLSGGETERVNLTACLGTRLVNTLFVLDEPSVGLHPRDTARLVRILERLRDAGNTVVVVEHEAAVIRAADQVVDLGPGHGESGGHVVFQGSCKQLLRSAVSLTGQYLSGQKRIEPPRRRPVHLGGGSRRLLPAGPGTYPLRAPGDPTAAWQFAEALPLPSLPSPMAAQGGAGSASDRAPDRDAAPPCLTLARATCHNLRDVTVEIPLGRLVCVTGVSGSGKTTLIKDVLLPALVSALNPATPAEPPAPEAGDDGANSEDESGSGPGTAPSARLTGVEHLGRVVHVDQSPLGRTPRSNPAVYIGAFDDLRELFARSDAAEQRGLGASAFSFNSAQGQCERCRGAGFEKIEMQFLSDIFIRCPDCDGRRYRAHILEVTLSSNAGVECPRTEVQGVTSGARAARGAKRATRRSRAVTPAAAAAPAWSIADLLDATVDEAMTFLAGFGDSTHARRAAGKLRLLQEVGLGYLRLGQPINTLSGGESQRLKLVSHLAESAPPITQRPAAAPASRPALFLFDEPTTGLHFDDVRVLLQVFQRLVDAGHSVLVIEHNLDVIRCADWVIDLGPGAGDEGGRIVAVGPPETIAACAASHTGRALGEAGVGTVGR